MAEVGLGYTRRFQGAFMRAVSVAIALVTLVVAVAIGFQLVGKPGAAAAAAPATPAPTLASFAAIAGQKGGQDHFGPYEVVANWPKPLSQLKDHEKWTWGAVQSIFAESPNRVWILMRGELPALQ